MCGIAGVHKKDGAAAFVAEALFAEQHRGQDSCGVVSSGASGLHLCKGLGLVKDVLTPEAVTSLPGDSAIGHVRYPTQGAPTLENAQPHIFERDVRALFAIASNGDLTNLPELREIIESHGYKLEGSNDGEVIAKAIGVWAYDDGLGLEEAIAKWVRTGRGAFSTVLLTPDTLYAFRDPHGFRPMSVGDLEGSAVVCSETVALDTLRARFVEEVPPGAIFRWGPDGHERKLGAASAPHRHCIFELIYFSRPDSRLFGESVFEVRRRIGELLAEGDETMGDIVIPIPDSANYMALGYAAARHLPFALGLVRNHYVGRTFIVPEQQMRDESVRLKFNPLPGFIKDKRIFVVDDSIVRGTTIRKLIRMLRENGAREVHLRIGSPPIRYSCYYGIDTPERDKLVAAYRSEAEVAALLGADSLRYLPLEALKKSVALPNDFCYACFTGDYPAGKKVRRKT